MTLEDQKLLETYTAIKTVVQLDPSFQKKVRVPVMAILGLQSAGKTSFMEALLRFPVGYTDRETGTRCPVRYILRNSSTGSSWKVGSKVLTARREVREEVTRHMKNLPGFSREPLMVEISEPNLLDMDITDLPGLKDQQEADAPEIIKIVKEYLDGDVMPVVLCKAMKSHETQMDVQSLVKLGLDTSRALFVVNYFNKEIGDLTDVSELNRYCQGYQGKFPQVRFVMLHYKDGINKEKMNFDELSSYYGALALNEQKAFQEFKKNMNPDQELDASIEPKIGLDSAFKYMHQMLQEWMASNRHAVLQALQEKKSELDQQRAYCQDVLGTAEDVKDLWRKYICDFEEVLCGIYEARQKQVADLHQTSRYSKRKDWAFTTTDLQTGSTFKEEMEMIPAGDRTWPFDIEDLEAEWKDTHLWQKMGMRLSAHAAFSRLQLVGGYMIMRHQLRPLSLQEIYSKNGHENGGLTHTFDKHGVLKQLVQEKLFDLQGSFGAALAHAEAIYQAPVGRVHEMLARSHPSASYHKGFQRELTGLFTKLLQAQLTKANEVLQQMIERKTSAFGVDLPTRMIILLGSTPLRQDIYRQAPVFFEEEIEEGSPEHKHPKGSTAPCPAGPAPCQGKVSHWHGTIDVSRRCPSAQGPPRHGHRRSALLDVKKALHNNRGNFCTVDFVEGGHQDLMPEEYSRIDEEEFNKDGEQYFHLLKGFLVIQFEETLNHDVYSFLKSELLKSVRKEMLQKLQDLSEEDMAKWRGDSKEVKEQLQRVEEELKHVESGFKTLGGVGVEPSEIQSEAPKMERCKIHRLEGDLHTKMDLSRIAKISHWCETFKACARKDLAEVFGVDESCICTEPRDEKIHYVVSLKGKDPHDVIRAKVQGKLAEGFSLTSSAKAYCKAMGVQDPEVGRVEAQGTSGKTTDSSASEAHSEAKTSSNQAPPVRKGWLAVNV